MTPLLIVTLVSHILLGIAAIGLAHLVLMQLLRKETAWGWTIGIASWSVFLFFASWATSAYYYVVYYGSSVKPVIKAGNYAWAHTIFMEGKEHVFLIIPFLALTVTLALHVLKKNPDPRLKFAVTLLASTLVILGLFVAISGIIVSGAAQ
ncbi:MAG: hypothetical protein JKX80_00480 [Candidatus Pacebacteria bacterium]|nr:hypothetical protein [Candidatus Paceibacterota bacterium]